MQYRVRAIASVCALILGLSAGTTLAQTPQIQAPPFCAISADASVPDAAMPNVNAGMAAFANKNYPVAYSHLHPLAEAGNPAAQRGLGLLLMQSCGPSGDRALAVSWIGKAAAAGDVPAAAALGRMYMNGGNVIQDDATAFAWLMQAAKGADADAQTDLGVLYSEGRGVAVDRFEGIAWWVRAGEQGAPLALVNIARSYANGLALPKDNLRAMFWLAAALQRATPLQRNQLATTFNTIARQISGDDARRMRQEAQKWSPGPGSLDDVLADAVRRRDGADAPASTQAPRPAPAPANAPLARSKRST
jgi:TPR repeat protein